MAGSGCVPRKLERLFANEIWTLRADLHQPSGGNFSITPGAWMGWVARNGGEGAEDADDLPAFRPPRHLWHPWAARLRHCRAVTPPLSGGSASPRGESDRGHAPDPGDTPRSSLPTADTSSSGSQSCHVPDVPTRSACFR